MLCGVTGIENTTLDNSASYVQSWLHQLKNDKTLIVSASQKAQKASDHILGVHKMKKTLHGGPCKVLAEYKITTHKESVRRWLRNGTLKGTAPTSRKEGWKISESNLKAFI
ncbi:zincin-like metallopeptidase domain-containing protein [Halobacillus seohaensis]|uniref:Zincin-like metallopeptidase domain-containing protein n=1 Tax=Halobacillus seohaensis TaxID=447421 RepID=A0ABW2EMM3_9BACI